MTAWPSSYFRNMQDLIFPNGLMALLMGFDNSGWVLTHACLSERDIREGAISMRGGLNKDPMTRIVRKLISFLVKRALKSRRVTEMALGDYFAKDEALWLPKGSVRASMALGLVGGSIYLAVSTG